MDHFVRNSVQDNMSSICECSCLNRAAMSFHSHRIVAASVKALLSLCWTSQWHHTVTTVEIHRHNTELFLNHSDFRAKVHQHHHAFRTQDNDFAQDHCQKAFTISLKRFNARLY